MWHISLAVHNTLSTCYTVGVFTIILYGEILFWLFMFGILNSSWGKGPNLTKIRNEKGRSQKKPQEILGNH
jgi:hypothetical protein